MQHFGKKLCCIHNAVTVKAKYFTHLKIELATLR